jgi:hypothetical protein
VASTLRADGLLVCRHVTDLGAVAKVERLRAVKMVISSLMSENVAFSFASELHWPQSD